MSGSMKRNMTCRQLTLSTYSQSILCESTIFRIHSIFNHGFNLVSSKNDLLFCTDQAVRYASTTIYMDHQTYATLIQHLLVDQIVQIKSNIWTFYGHQPFHLDVENQTVFHCDKPIILQRMQWQTFFATYQSDLQCCVDTLRKQSGFEGTTIPVLPKVPFPQQSSLSISQLKALIGLGIGLTPTGDDFVLGYVLAVKAKNPTVGQQVIGHFCDEPTSDVSRMAFRALSHGQMDLEWHRLIEAINENNLEKFMLMLNRLIEKGATSGCDQMLGFLHGLMYWEEEDE